MLRSGKHYQPEMSEVVELLKAWKEEREEDKRRYEQRLQEQREEREQEKRRYERHLQEQENRFEQLVQGLTERRPRRVEVGPESLKLTKLAEGDDIEAFLTTFERAVEAHGVDRDKRAAILAPQLSGKARLAEGSATRKYPVQDFKSLNFLQDFNFLRQDFKISKKFVKLYQNCAGINGCTKYSNLELTITGS